MEDVKERNFVCKFCRKEFLSGKALGGHIRIHTNENSVDSEKNKRLALKQRKQQQQQLVRCRECDQEFDSLKAFCNHMASHSMDSQSDTETCSSPTRKRSKRILMQQQSFSNGSSSSASEIDQEHKHMALSLMMMSRDPSFKNSLAESSDNNSVILETKSSSGKVAVAVDEQLRSGGCDSDSSGSDYFMNGPKKSDSDDISISISVDGNNANKSLMRKSDEGGSKYELRKKSKRQVLFFPCYETDSCEAVKIHSKKAKKKSKGHECPICFRVFKSGQALGGHKRSHFIGNQEQVAEMHRHPIDLNLPALEID